MNVLDVLAGRLAAQRQLIAEATLEQVLARVPAGGSLGQSLVQAGLLNAVVFQGLLREVQSSRLLCPGCGSTVTPAQLDPLAPLSCARCRATLIVATASDVNPEAPPGTGRIPRQGDTHTGSRRPQRLDTPPTFVSTRSGSDPLGSDRRSGLSGSGRRADPTGSMRFRHALERPGGAVGEFELLEELGRGGMGVVYKARHTGRDEVVALKVLLAGALASQRQRKRFEREISAMTRLNHPNVVSVKDVGTFGESPYFTMDLVEGRPLGDLISAERLSVRRSAEIAREVALGLQHAHEAGIVHRDIKPDNILVDLSGIALITDFGLARDLDDDSDRLTRSGALVGTPFYMSPEQASGKRNQISGATDVYAVGVVLFHMLTGVLPFEGETQLELMNQIVSASARWPSELNSDVPDDLDRVVLKCMVKVPADRYATAGDLADDLQRYLEGHGVNAKARSRPRPWLKIAAGFLLCSLAATAVGWLVVERQSAERERLARERLERERIDAAIALATKRDHALDRVDAAEIAAKEATVGVRYRQALSDLAGALDEARELNPKLAPLALRRGLVREFLHDYEQARRDYAEAWDLDEGGATGCEALLRDLWLQKRGGTRKVALADELGPRLAEVGDRAGAWKATLQAFYALLRAEDSEAYEAAATLASEARRRDPSNALAWAVDGAAQASIEELAAAVIAGEQAATMEPRHPFLVVSRGLLYRALGRWDDAADDAAEALRLDPDLAEALALRGTVRGRSGDVRGAISDLERALSALPRSANVLLNLAQIYRMNDQPERCDPLLSRAEKVDPGRAWIYGFRVQLQLEQLRLDDALSTLRRGIFNMRDPALARALHLRFIDLAQGCRRWRTLRDYANGRLDADPKDAWGLEAQGDLSLYRGRFAEALVSSEKLMRTHPTFVPGWEQKLEAMIQSGVDPARVREHVRQLLSTFPDDAVALCAGVKYHLSVTQDFAVARELAQRAVKANPKSALAWRYLALVEAFADRLEEMEQAAQRAIGLDPDDYQALHLLAEVRLKRGKLKDALSYYHQALGVFPFYADSNTRVASLYLSQGKSREAAAFVDHYMAVMSAANRQPSISMTIHQVQALIGTRRLSQANDMLDRLLEAPPKEFEDRRFLAICLVNADRVAEGRQLLLQLNREDPTHRLVNELLSKIGRE